MRLTFKEDGASKSSPSLCQSTENVEEGCKMSVLMKIGNITER